MINSQYQILYISTGCGVMLCLHSHVTSSPIISFWSLYFTLCLIFPQYPLTPFTASTTWSFSTAPTSEQTDLPPSTAPQATTERDMACQIVRQRTNVVASIIRKRKHTYEAFEADGVPC